MSGYAATEPALPTVSDVYNEVQKGNVPAAIIMATKIVKAHPENAEAHYALSKIMIIRNAKDFNSWKDAKKEFETAKQLQPDLSFATVSDVAELQANIESAESHDNDALSFAMTLVYGR